MSALSDVPDNYPLALAQAVLRFYSDFQLSIDQLRVKADQLSHPAAVWAHPTRVVADGLSVGLAVDVGKFYVRVSDQMLEHWGVDFSTMLDEVVRRRVFDQQFGSYRFDDKRTGSALGLIADEALIPAMFVHPPLATVLTQPHRPVVLPLKRTECLVAREGDTVAIAQMAGDAESALSDDESVVQTIVPQWWDGQRWWPMTWEQLGLSAERASLLRAKWAGYAYGIHRGLLKQSLGDCSVVAKITVGIKGGAGLTSTGWVETPIEEQVIPVADWVAFVPTKDGAGVHPSPDRRRVIMMWSQVRAAFGDLMEPMGLAPEWYRVRAFPPYNQLAALGKVL